MLRSLSLLCLPLFAVTVVLPACTNSTASPDDAISSPSTSEDPDHKSKDAGGGSSADAGAAPDSAPAPIDCEASLQKRLAAPMVPGTSMAGFAFAGKKNSKGLTIADADADGCGAIEPANPAKSGGGIRTADWGNGDVSVSYNMQSGTVNQVVVGPTYQGTVKFQSRAGGAFGAHTYEMGVAIANRDGAAITIDWTQTPNAVLNELADGMVATFLPSAPAIVDCRAEGTCLIYDDGTTAIFGVRPVSFYSTFASGQSQPSGFYTFWKAGLPDCSTPVAVAEEMDWSGIENGFAGPVGEGFAGLLGNLILSTPGSNPNGMTWQEANAKNCNGKHVAAADPGYGAIEWGTAGEVVLEYNRTTSLGYKVSAREGYQGSLAFTAADGLQDAFVINIGSMTKNGSPYVIDWAHAKEQATELSNAMNELNETDCTATGNCTITADNGDGKSVIAFPSALTTLLFAKETSAPSEIQLTWPAGQ